MEDRYRGEKVLVFPRSLLEELGSFNGTSSEIDHYMAAILTSGNNHFHDRCLAEGDPSWKQIIAYVVFRCGDRVFSYVRGRKAGEQRLVGNRSIGIGGHVNPIDRQVSDNRTGEDLATYMEAVRREISEEVVVDEAVQPRIVALLNDDTNEVGKVHFGVIHVCDLTTPAVRKKEQQITESGFLPIAELAGPRLDELENWSRIAIEFLNTH